MHVDGAVEALFKRSPIQPVQALHNELCARQCEIPLDTLIKYLNFVNENCDNSGFIYDKHADQIYDTR